MNMNNSYNELKVLIAKELGCQPQEIADDIGWNKTVNWDSLTHISIITAVENHFNISIEDNQIEYLRDFKSILKFINNNT